ncbi:cytochrome ubiquinol oxidase subunit I [Fastidiosibacter lacustris]|uniref:cytochrome ubiquinol oxidase subunit I n=1 Tax=Fastidiosibacter lacustris TaxID=2056695 RepID=UPI000E347D80|nr:cytochrome ubiquinol oxidase subunit I [Fastidiosibacter lacustris]
MDISQVFVDLSRSQFAFTAIFHFVFVPLTLGLSWILFIMEAAYVKTGRPVYRDMVKFWGKLFAINFAMGVVTGITMEFEFGLNWAYFSRFIGESFGTVLAIEGLTAFMTEATLFGLFFFTWDKVSNKTHLLITFFLALGTNLSIVNILVANSWMQHPVATFLNPTTMQMQLTSFGELYMQELAQIRIGHVAFAGYLISAAFVVGISAWYLLRKRNTGFAMRSLAVGLGFGLCSSVFIFFLGDANGLAVDKYEPAKMAAIEGQWETQKAPAAWSVIAFPSQENEINYFDIKIPWMLSLITGHNLKATVDGLKPIMQQNEKRIYDGLVALKALERVRNGNATAKDFEVFDPKNEVTKKYRDNIGYAFILQAHAKDPYNSSSAELNKAVKDTIPQVWPVFYAFRIMLACWCVVFFVMTFGAVHVLRRSLLRYRWFLWLSLFSIPLPYIASEAGWIVAEMGRQPWVINGILPTSLGVSTLVSWNIVVSLAFFALLYFGLFIIELIIMFKVARKGPKSLGNGRYDSTKGVSDVV